MKEIVFVNQGDSYNKIVYMLGTENLSKNISDDKKFGHNYYCSSMGTDDVIVVKNYHPYFMRMVGCSDTIFDWYAQGYEVVGNETLIQGDRVLLKRLNGIRYVVKPLENINDIALRFGISIEEIMKKNNLISDKLFIGQILII